MIINDNIIRDDVFSFTEIVKHIIKSKRLNGTMLSMLEYFVDCGILERNIIDYGNRKINNYEINEEFGELLEGHWVAKRCKRKGKITNNTLYFSEFGANVLANIYKARNEYCLECMKTKMIYEIILQTAISFCEIEIKTVNK